MNEELLKDLEQDLADLRATEENDLTALKDAARWYSSTVHSRAKLEVRIAALKQQI